MADTKTPPAGHIPLVGAKNAPIIHFDGVPHFGALPGVGRLALEALIDFENPDGTLTKKRMVVAHLRGNALALQSLRSALDGLTLLATEAENTTKN